MSKFFWLALTVLTLKLAWHVLTFEADDQIHVTCYANANGVAKGDVVVYSNRPETGMTYFDAFFLRTLLKNTVSEALYFAFLGWIVFVSLIFDIVACTIFDTVIPRVVATLRWVRARRQHQE